MPVCIEVVLWWCWLVEHKHSCGMYVANMYTCRSLQQHVEDSAHQLAVALQEVQRLQSGGATAPAPAAPGAVQLSTAQQVITEHLRSFQDIQGLVAQNARLLQVSRELAREAEASQREAQAAVRHEYDVKLAQLAAELEESVTARQRQQGIMEQVVRQRDMYKKLYGDASAGGATVAAAAIEAPPAQPPADVAALLADKDKEIETTRANAEEVAAQLRKELLAAQANHRSADTLAATSAAEAAFHKERTQRMESDLGMLRKQLEDATTSRGTVEQLLTDALDKYNTALHAAEAAKQEAMQQRLRANEAESMRKLLEEAERKATAEAQSLRVDKMKLAAEVEVGARMHEERSMALKREKDAAEARLADLEQQRTEAERSLAEAQRRAEHAAAAAAAATNDAAQRASAAEQDARRLQERASAAEQRAASAEAKVELLHKAVNAAEQRVATLEMQASRGGRVASTALVQQGAAETAAELQLLREELSAAQETAAAATANAKTFQALAASSDEALKAMQVCVLLYYGVVECYCCFDVSNRWLITPHTRHAVASQTEHDRYKAEATRRLEAESAAAAALRGQLSALEEQAQGLRERVEALTREREQADEAHNGRLAALRAEVSKQEGVAQQAAVRGWV